MVNPSVSPEIVYARQRITELERDLNRATQGRWGSWELELAKAKGHALSSELKAEELRAENAKLRELLGRARTHLVYSTKNPHEPELAKLIDEIDGRK